MLLDVAATHIVGGDLLVHRVSLDVLGEIAGLLIRSTEPGSTGGVLAIGKGRRHLEGGQMAEQGWGPTTVDREQRHHVGDRQRDRRYGGNVVAVGVVEPEPAHRRT